MLILNDFRPIDRIFKIAHNRSMSYDVGTHIDLTHLNKKKGSAAPQKKTLEQKTRHLYAVGTKLIFEATQAGYQAAVKIPVALA